jgi:hypothetical protein
MTRNFSSEPPAETNRPPKLCRVLWYHVSRGSLLLPLPALASVYAASSAASMESLHTLLPWCPAIGKQASFHSSMTEARAGGERQARLSPSLVGPPSLRWTWMSPAAKSTSLHCRERISPGRRPASMPQANMGRHGAVLLISGKPS